MFLIPALFMLLLIVTIGPFMAALVGLGLVLLVMGFIGLIRMAFVLNRSWQALPELSGDTCAMLIFGVFPILTLSAIFLLTV